MTPHRCGMISVFVALELILGDKKTCSAEDCTDLPTEYFLVCEG